MSELSHDTLFKRLLQNHFTEFLTSCFPQVAEQLDLDDFTEDDFLNQEQLPEIDGRVYKLDVVAKVKLKESVNANKDDAFVIIFVEAQHTRRKEFLERVFRYFYLLHLKHKTTVIPIVIYSDQAGWRHEEDWTQFKMEFAGLEIVRFKFYAIKPSLMKIKDYLRSSNPVELARASLMSLDQEDLLQSKLQLLRRLNKLKITEQQQANLIQFVDNYLEVDGEEFEKEVNLVEADELQGDGMLVEYFTNKGIEQGLEQGLERGIEQGLERGIEQGEVLASLKIAQAMLKKGLEWTVVEEMTSVTREQYEKWVKP